MGESGLRKVRGAVGGPVAVESSAGGQRDTCSQFDATAVHGQNDSPDRVLPGEPDAQPIRASIDQVRITREGTAVTIEHADASIAPTHLTLGDEIVRTLRTITESWSVSVRSCDSGRLDSVCARTVLLRWHD